MVEVDAALHVGDVDRFGVVLELGLRVEHLDHALAAGHRALKLRVLQHEIAYRIEEELQLQREGDQRGDFHLAVQHAIAAVRDDERHADRDDHLDRGRDCGGEAAGIDVRAQVLFVDRVEALGVFVLAREALDDADAGDVLLQVRVDDGDRLAHADESAARIVLPDRHRQDEDGHDRERDERQPHVEIHEKADADEDARDVADDRQEAAGHQVLQRRHVARHARHDAPDLVVVVKAQRELLQVREQIAPQAEQQPLADPAGRRQLKIEERRRERRERDVHPAPHVQAAEVLVERRVDQPANGERHGARHEGVPERTEQREREAFAVRRDELVQAHDDAVVVDGAELVVIPAVGAALQGVRAQVALPVAVVPAPPAR